MRKGFAVLAQVGEEGAQLAAVVRGVDLPEGAHRLLELTSIDEPGAEPGRAQAPHDRRQIETDERDLEHPPDEGEMTQNCEGNEHHRKEAKEA